MFASPLFVSYDVSSCCCYDVSCCAQPFPCVCVVVVLFDVLYVVHRMIMRVCLFVLLVFALRCRRRIFRLCRRCLSIRRRKLLLLCVCVFVCVYCVCSVYVVYVCS